MVKLGEAKKRKLSKHNITLPKKWGIYKFCGNRGEIDKFCGNKMGICNMHLCPRGGWTRLALARVL